MRMIRRRKSKEIRRKRELIETQIKVKGSLSLL